MEHVTPDDINSLPPNSIFVFGSNLQGCHDGGAAKTAVEKFGAIYGKGVGTQGQSYAIPTMGGLEELWQYALDFIEYAILRSDLVFYLTRIGCGIAGYSDELIAPIFANTPKNVIKPKGW